MHVTLLSQECLYGGILECNTLPSIIYSCLRWCKIAHHLFSSFFSGKPSAKVADVGKLLWPQTSYIVCVSASVPLIAIKRCCLRVSSTLRICVHCRTPSYIAPPFPVMPTFTSVILHHMLELLCWTSWLSILSYWSSSYRYWHCRVPLTALLSHYQRNIVDLYVTVIWWLG